MMLIAISGCQERQMDRFTFLSKDQTNVHFSNDITENDSINILEYHYLYNGGGVGIGDFNNDGLDDLVFTGNQVASKIYINKGSLEFVDVTETAKFNTNGWVTGVSVVDINADGWLDIYISVGGKYCEGTCINQLFIHQGLDENGHPVFEEKANEYGLMDGFYTQQAAFFDYDRDGDLDVYLLHNVINQRDKNEPAPKRYIHPSSQDVLFRNDSEDSEIKFTDISTELGITNRGYGLGIAIHDFNQDGWADIYVANDFLSPDLMYLNLQTKNDQHLGFEEVNDKVVGHTTYNSMGVEVTDVNNDALPDIFTVDMLPNYQERQKTMVGFMNYNKFMMAQDQGYTAQFMRNTLQIHNGLLGDSLLQFSEIGHYSGIYSTDWSWAPIFADFDNDADKDLYITNGYVKDITDLDFVSYNNNNKVFGSPEAKKKRLMMMLDEMKGVKISNFLYENNGDLTFEDQSEEWIAAKNSYSNGAAYADLDNDGDLDIVVNNINDKAFVIQNNSINTNYLQITLKGTEKNPNAIGSQITIWHGKQLQTKYVHPVLGYLSSAQTAVHFGLGNSETIDSLEIRWPNGSIEKRYNIPTNQKMFLEFNSHDFRNWFYYTPRNRIFKNVTATTFQYKHQENRHFDFNNQRLLLSQHSRQGPCVVTANIDGQAGDEVFIGGARNQLSQIVFEQSDGSFISTALDDKKTEAVNALFVDIDNDEDLDLYVVNGSSEVRFGADYYQDVLYLNNGQGGFTKSKNALPIMKTSTSKAVAIDFDKDGDQDIFVGGRVTPHQYPQIPRSYLLENKNGIFQDATPEALQYLGMITDILAIDYNKNGWDDLVIVGEWMPLTFINNENGQLSISEKMTSKNTTGWWNCLASGDFDKDGDVDFLAGNLGLNSRLKASNEEPIQLFTGDLDQNGSKDPLIGHFYKNLKGNRRAYPLHSRDDVVQQIPMVKNKWVKYIDFGQAHFNQLLSLTPVKDNKLTIKDLRTSYFQNEGDGSFTSIALPQVCQWSPIQSILVDDFDKDGNLDALMVGNDYTAETNGGWYDANTGILLKGNGKGNFEAVSSANSGFYTNGDNRDISLLNHKNGEKTVWVGRNSAPLKVFKF